mmetsp:Transcript_12787/g.12688  ORF Transcript_12787/g.12688 Transcript_12787/m.12688 type:complete len:92 (+) Transcript_12787:17-292(+)
MAQEGGVKRWSKALVSRTKMYKGLKNDYKIERQMSAHISEEVVGPESDSEEELDEFQKHFCQAAKKEQKSFGQKELIHHYPTRASKTNQLL